MAFTPRQRHITLEKKKTHSERVRLDTHNATEGKDEQRDHAGPAGTMTALGTGGGGGGESRNSPPVSSAHTGHKRERREGEAGSTGRERTSGGGGGCRGSRCYCQSWKEIGSMAGAACLWLRSAHVSTLWLLIFMSSQQGQLFDCLLIGQFVVFKQALEHSL